MWHTENILVKSIVCTWHRQEWRPQAPSFCPQPIHRTKEWEWTRWSAQHLWRRVPNRARTRSRTAASCTLDHLLDCKQRRNQKDDDRPKKLDFRTHDGHTNPITTFSERSETFVLNPFLNKWSEATAKAKLSPSRIAMRQSTSRAAG